MRSGWAILLAVAGLLLSGAFVVRLGKRKRTARPAPLRVTAVPQAPKSDASRQLVRMAIGAGIVVVLALVTVVVTRPPDSGATAQRRALAFHAPTVAPPMDRYQKFLVSGLDGSRAEVGVDEVREPETGNPLTGDPGYRSVTFSISVSNVGDRPIDADLRATSWVTLDDLESIRPYEGIPSRLDLGHTPAVVGPGQVVYPHLSFAVPRSARVKMLHVGLQVGGADWSL